MKTSCKITSVLCVHFLLFTATGLQAQRMATERGQWSAPRAMDRAAMNIFHDAVGSETDGVRYTPTSYSIQIVEGRRYRFHCRSSVVDAPIHGAAMITVFVHYGGEIELAAIQDTTRPKETAPGSDRTYSSVTAAEGKWLTEPLYPRTGPYLQAPRKTVRRVL